MIGLNGGLIGSQRSANNTTASGIWTDNEQVLLKRVSSWPTGGDPYYANTSLLLHMDGSNGSTTFTDNSSNALTVTANGNAQISTTQSKFGGSSGYFDGSGDYLDVTEVSSVLTPGTGDFTLEGWFYTNASATYRSGWRTGANDSFRGVFLWNQSANQLMLLINGTNYFEGTNNTTTAAGTGPSSSTWFHLAVVRSSGVFTAYLNGTSKIIVNNQTSHSITTAINRIGASNSNSEHWNGYMDDLRFTKGIARYTSNFTPPTAPFSNF